MADCAGDLVCKQRSKGDPIPSPCSGSTSNQKDYCIPPEDNYGLVSSNTDTRDLGKPFRLRLYWEEGYYWQENSREKFWCMEYDYRGSSQTNGKCWYGLDSTSCNPKHIYTEKCSKDSNQLFVFDFVNEDEALIKVYGQNRCMERSGLEINLEPCNSDKSEQRFFAIKGGFDEYRFEISQKTALRYCVNQAHHPSKNFLPAPISHSSYRY